MPTTLPKALFLIVTTLGVMVSEAAFASSQPTANAAEASVLPLQGLTAQLPFPTVPGLNRGDRDEIREQIEDCMDEDDRDDRRDCFDDLRQEQAEDWDDRQDNWDDRQDNWDDRQEEIEDCLDENDRDDRRECFDDLREDQDDWRSQRNPLSRIQFGGWQPRFPANGFPRF